MTFSRRLPFLILGSVRLLIVPLRAQDAAGKQQFISHCAVCHGADGHGGPLGPTIVDVQNPRATSVQAVRSIVRMGIPSAGMPAFTTLSDAEVDSVAAYVMSLKAPTTPAVPAQQTTPVHGDIHAGFNTPASELLCDLPRNSRPRRCHRPRPQQRRPYSLHRSTATGFAQPRLSSARSHKRRRPARRWSRRGWRRRGFRYGAYDLHSNT